MMVILLDIMLMCCILTLFSKGKYFVSENIIFFAPSKLK